MTSSRTLASAITSHDNSFNMVRLVAALLVVLYHAGVLNPAAPGLDPVSALLAPAADLGALAVDVFFVLSGIFITQSWLRDPHVLRFAARRVARLVPGLLVCLALTTVIAVGWFSAEGWSGLASSSPWRYIVNGAALHWLQYIIPPQDLALPGVLGGQALNGSLWTVYWEGRMYVAVALIGVAALAAPRRSMMVAAPLLILSALLFPAVLDGYIWETTFWVLFLSGMLLQTLSEHVRFGWRQAAAALALLALNWTRWADLKGHGLTTFGAMLVCVTLALWLGSQPLPAALRHLKRHDYSYAIYIYHWPVMLMLKAAMPSAGVWTMLAAALAIVLPLAATSWHLVESPALAWTRRKLTTRAPVSRQ